MSTLTRLTIVATLCGVAGCTLPPQSTPEPKQFGYTRSGVSGPTVFRGLVQPMNGGAVRGNVVITPTQGGSTSVATLALAGPSGTYSWHIRYGPCASTDGALLGGRADYTTFQVGPEGSGRATATIQSVPSGGNFHVVIHASDDPTADGNVVGCGELLNTGV
jgi:hypothetical protein